jgi:hypothetical protein
MGYLGQKSYQYEEVLKKDALTLKILIIIIMELEV